LKLVLLYITFGWGFFFIPMLINLPVKIRDMLSYLAISLSLLLALSYISHVPGEKHGFTLWYLDTTRQTFQTVEFLIAFLN
jgi:hypothetical protein